jgi:colanic acid biosynthesis glycosyl transferase WcaI
MQADERLWVITELYYPEHTSTGHFLTGIAEGLAQRFAVKVICSQPTYSARGTRAPAYEIRNAVEIRRCRSTTLNKDVLAFRLMNALTFGMSTFAAAVRRIKRGDLVLVVTTPPTLPVLMESVCRLRKARLVILVHDVYPDVLTATGTARPGSSAVRLLDWLYRRVFRRAEMVVVLGRDMLRLLSGRIAPERMTIIPNWGDVDRITPRPRSDNPVLRRFGLTDAFVVHYLGNMGRTHDLKLLLAAAARVNGGPTHFLFTGDGWQRDWISAEVERADLTNVSVQAGCSSDELCDYLNACDVAVISFRRGMSGVSVPSRLYNVLAAGTPVLAVCESESELACVVREHECGWVVEPGDLDGLLRALADAREDSAARRAMASRARSAATQFYNRHRIIQQYVELFEGLMRRRASVAAACATPPGGT